MEIIKCAKIYIIITATIAIERSNFSVKSIKFCITSEVLIIKNIAVNNKDKM